MKKICFPAQKCVCYSCTLRKMYQYSFFKNFICSSEPLGLIQSDLLEFSTLSYSKYKQVITFLDNHSFYYNIVFLCKKSEVAEAVKFIFWMWSNITFHPVKRLHTDNKPALVPTSHTPIPPIQNNLSTCFFLSFLFYKSISSLSTSKFKKPIVEIEKA